MRFLRERSTGSTTKTSYRKGETATQSGRALGPAQPIAGHNRRRYWSSGPRSISRKCLANRPGNSTLCKWRSLLPWPGRKR